MKQITRKEYYELFRKEKRKNALKYAMQIREFEIQLYWKRAGYFWAFVSILAGAFFYTMDNCNYTYSFLLANIGFIFSFAWFLVNKGSKYWQSNWECHVDALQDDHIGPLYRIITKPDNTQNYITREGRYSVSKINQLISFYVTILWGISIFVCCLTIASELGLFDSLYKNCKIAEHFTIEGSMAISFFLVTLFFFFSLINSGKSNNKPITVTFQMRESAIDNKQKDEK